MKKSEFIGIVAKKAGLTTAQSSAAMDAVLGTITEELQNGGKVQFTALAPLKSAYVPPIPAAIPRPENPWKLRRARRPSSGQARP